MGLFSDIAKYRDDISSTGAFGKLFVKLFGLPNIYLYNTYFHFKRILKWINTKDNSTVLDAGCGKGYFAFWLAKKYPNLFVEGWDLGKDNISFCENVSEKEDLDNMSFSCDDLKNLSFENKYDFIYCLSVLEHIPDNELVIKKFHQALKKGGYFFALLPAGRSLNKYFDEKHYAELEHWAADEHIGEHYTVDELSTILTDNGFTIVDKRTNGGFLPAYAWQANDILFRNKRKFALAVTYPFLKFIAFIGNTFNLIYDNKKGDTMILAMKN